MVVRILAYILQGVQEGIADCSSPKSQLQLQLTQYYSSNYSESIIKIKVVIYMWYTGYIYGSPGSMFLLFVVHPLIFKILSDIFYFLNVFYGEMYSVSQLV